MQKRNVTITIGVIKLQLEAWLAKSLTIIHLTYLYCNRKSCSYTSQRGFVEHVANQLFDVVERRLVQPTHGSRR